MTDKEAIAACKAGERVVTDQTRESFPQTPTECGFRHFTRVVACDDDQDVIECSKCGVQKLARCNFDEDYS